MRRGDAKDAAEEADASQGCCGATPCHMANVARRCAAVAPAQPASQPLQRRALQQAKAPSMETGRGISPPEKESSKKQKFGRGGGLLRRHRPKAMRGPAGGTERRQCADEAYCTRDGWGWCLSTCPRAGAAAGLHGRRALLRARHTQAGPLPPLAQQAGRSRSPAALPLLEEGHVAQHVELRAGGGRGQVLLHRLAAGGGRGVRVQHVDALGEPAGRWRAGRVGGRGGGTGTGAGERTRWPRRRRCRGKCRSGLQSPRAAGCTLRAPPAPHACSATRCMRSVTAPALAGTRAQRPATRTS